jgi:hypothetical protein
MPISQIVTNSIANGAVGATQTATTNQFYGFKNRLINGDMTIAQRGTTAFTVNVSSGDLFPVDRFNAFVGAGSGVFTAQQSSDVPTGSGFNRSVILTVTTADGSLVTGDLCALRQIIEGFNAADLMWGTANAQPVTLSFWAKSSVTGTHSGNLTNGDWTRAYAFTYTISAANTWQYITITAPGAPTGTWGSTNDRGIQVVFNMGAASANLSTANTWTTTSLVTTGATGSVQLISTLGATFQITGVQFEKGSTATSYDYLPYTTELALCQRYFCKTYNMDIVPGAGSNAGYPGSLRTAVQTTNSYTGLGPWSFPVYMRATPAMTIYNPQNGAVGGFVGDGTNYSPAVPFNAGQSGCSFYTNNVTIGTATFIAIAATAAAEL